MEFNNVNPWTALGLEEPAEDPAAGAPEGGNDPAVAAPEGTGENDPEPAEPDTEEEPEPETDEEPEQEPKQKREAKPMSKEQRAENARRRRQKEINDAVAAALAEERKKQKEKEDAFFKVAGMKNAHKGGAEIKSLDDALDWVTDDRVAKANDRIKKGQMTAEDLQAMVEETPAFKAMQERLAAREREDQAQSMQQFGQTMELELAEIKKLNPNINNLADILRMDTGKDFARFVKGGASYLKAYKAANMETLMQQAQQVAAAGARVASGGKDHLRKTQSRGQGALEVPADVKANYRALMPGMTDEEIQRDYNKFMKGK